MKNSISMANDVKILWRVLWGQYRQVNYYKYNCFKTIRIYTLLGLIWIGEENCPYDYIKIYDGKNELSPVIGTFCGMGKFPYSIIGTSQDIFVEFVTSPAGTCIKT